MNPVEGSEVTVSTPWNTGWIRSPSGLPVPVHCRDVNGWAVAEGCILLGKTYDVLQRAQNAAKTPQLLRDASGGQLQGHAIVGTRYRWPGPGEDGTYAIPYVIAAGLDPARQQVAREAIEGWQRSTKLRFWPQTDETDYVEFTGGVICSSFVGRQGGVQPLQLALGCSVGNVMHEIGHLIGLWHEHNRPDRDQFVTIAMSNVDPQYAPNFFCNIKDGAVLGPYDYGSIMHYPEIAFALDTSRPTIIPLQGCGPIGQRTALSAGDIAAALALYP